MKGPRGRSKFDLRRVWECPCCGQRAYSNGRVINRVCACADSVQTQQWMRLIEQNPTPPPSVSQESVQASLS